MIGRGVAKDHCEIHPIPDDDSRAPQIAPLVKDVRRVICCNIDKSQAYVYSFSICEDCWEERWAWWGDDMVPTVGISFSAQVIEL